MTLKEFFSVFESSNPFQNYLNQYYPSSELQNQSNELNDSAIEGDNPFDWSISFDNLAIHLSDDEFKNLFEQIEQGIDEDKKEDFFDYFNRLITQTGYKKRFEEEQASIVQEEESFDALAMRLESGKRISWLCDWVTEQNTVYSSVSNDEIEPLFEWAGDTKKFTELILFLQIRGWIKIPGGLSTNNTKLARHFAKLVRFPEADETTLVGNLTDYIKPFNFKKRITENTFNKSEKYSLNSLSFNLIEENQRKPKSIPD